jgi:hypothetical protein
MTMNVKLGGIGGVSPVVHFHTVPLLHVVLVAFASLLRPTPYTTSLFDIRSDLILSYCFVLFRLGLHIIAFEIMQSELLTEGEKSTGLMSLRQTEYFTGDEKHLKFLEGYPDVSPSPSPQSYRRPNLS